MASRDLIGGFSSPEEAPSEFVYIFYTQVTVCHIGAPISEHVTPTAASISIY
jgi:hypothetical protein